MTDIPVEYFPAGYDWQSRFQDVRLIRGFEGVPFTPLTMPTAQL